MHKRARSWANWLALAILLLMLGAGGASLAVSRQTLADRHSLKNDVSELKSQAGVSRLIAAQALAGNLTGNYVESQAAQIEKGVVQAREQLTPDAFQPELSTQVSQAADLARRLGGALDTLREAGSDREAAESARKNLDGLCQELSQLEEGLKE